jgi:starch synthase
VFLTDLHISTIILQYFTQVDRREQKLVSKNENTTYGRYWPVRMRVILLTNEYPPHIYGGAGVHVEYLSRELLCLDGGSHDLDVLCFGDQKVRFANETVRGVRPDFGFPYQDAYHRKMLDALFRNIIMTGLAKEGDIVHCHTWYTLLAGCLIKQILGIPLLITAHSLEPQRPWKHEQLGSAYRASSWVEKTAYQNADGIIAVSNFMKSAIHDIYGVEHEKIRVIPNGIDMEQYKPTPDAHTLSVYGIDSSEPFILFVGRITRQKGTIHLVNAIKYLDPVQVVICADAPDTEEIDREMKRAVRDAQAETQNRIIWINRFVPRADAIRLYSHASVFVCPSIYEPFGIINLEAMACKTPVVATAVGGIPEIVAHGETGLLVPFEAGGGGLFEPREPDRFSRDLAEAVNSLLRSPQKMKEMGERARESIERKFSWQTIARRTLEFYRDTLDSAVCSDIR